jgi:RNA polymerase sigma factor (sigma-70 family)
MDDADRERRWALVVPHRERLLRLARGLLRDAGDAEACVQEAMLRCVTFPRLDESNVAGFLVVTTRRLCVDQHRRAVRDGQVAARLDGMSVVEPRFDEAVCDRAEAAWVAARLADLPERQRAVVHARRDGRSPKEIAEFLDLSYKTVETLLYRARSRARAELERAYGLLAIAARRPRAAYGAAGLTSVAVVAVTVLLVPGHGTARHTPPPPRGGVAGAAGPETTPVPAFALPAAAMATAAPPAWRSPSPAPAAPGGGRAPDPSPARCPAPPYTADPCIDPSPDPADPPLLSLLDCVRYGVDLEVGFRCRSAEPSPSPAPDTEGAP